MNQKTFEFLGCLGMILGLALGIGLLGFVGWVIFMLMRFFGVI